MTGSFAIWGTLFSICDCTFTYIRKKEDPWNAIASGAATGGTYVLCFYDDFDCAFHVELDFDICVGFYLFFIIIFVLIVILS